MLCCYFVIKQIFLTINYFWIYTAQAIDITLLKSLTHDLIKELIPNIGLRMRFTIKWKEHFGISNDVIIFFTQIYFSLK